MVGNAILMRQKFKVKSALNLELFHEKVDVVYWCCSPGQTLESARNYTPGTEDRI